MFILISIDKTKCINKRSTCIKISLEQSTVYASVKNKANINSIWCSTTSMHLDNKYNI